MAMELPAFREPRFDAPVDLEAHLRSLPADASCKGLFFEDQLRRAEASVPRAAVFERAGVAPRPFRAFLDYDYREYLRLTVAAAELLFPHAPLGEGLRQIGRGAYRTLADSHIGKVIFGVLGQDFRRVAAVGAKGWKISLNFGSVRFEELGENGGLYVFEGTPILIETLQVGVVEGAMEATGVEGRVRVHLDDISNGILEYRWDA